MPVGSQAQCNTAPVNGSYSTARTASIGFSNSYPAKIKNGIRAGLAAWNDCNGHDNGFIANDWPYFSEGPGGSEDRITIKYLEGKRPACGAFNGSTYEISIWDSYTSGGVTVNCTHSADAINDTIAHELGHYLGLGHNDGCDTAIMGGIRVSPSGNLLTDHEITSAEKAKADAINTNDQEEFEEDCGGDQGCGNQGGGSPIILDLDGRGFRLTGLADPVAFDIDGDQALESIGWTERGSGDGFLFRNRTRTRGFENGIELFGDASRTLLTGARTAHGYEALAEFDLADLGGNENGWIDSGDAFFKNLGVWIDHNHDAISQPGELFTLRDLAIARLGFQFVTSRRTDEHGNEFRYWGRAWESPGSDRKSFWTTDVFFILED